MGKGKSRKPKRKDRSQKRRRPPRQLTPKPEVKRVDEAELKALIERAGEGPLSEDEREELRGVVDTLAFLVRELDQKNLTMRRLRALFGLATSEKLSKLLDKPQGEGAESGDAEAGGAGEGDEPEDEASDKPKGHGRNGADAYTGADRVAVPHQCLKPGDACPACQRGKLYEQRHRPRTLIRVEGQGPIKATVYELQALRCGLCGELFVAEAPEGVGQEKYNTTSKAMLAVLRYGSGLPFNRIERLEWHLGVPLPASTQWEVVLAAAGDLTPVYDALVWAAAQGELIHTDDSSARVLELMQENAENQAAGTQRGVRTGTFVTGLVAQTGEHRIGLFFTGRDHAGENLQALLDERTDELGPPLHMSDGLSRNDPAQAATLRGTCLAHGRRKFVEVAESFPAQCQHVLEEIAKVYKHDDACRRLGLSAEERLDYHVEFSKPVTDALEAWFERQFEERLVEPNSSLGGAINYMLNHWHELTLFLREPGAPLDNNAAERALKKAILHRKNSLFYKTLNGARVGDLFMSLIYTTELAGGNPFRYLTALLDHAEQVAEEPKAWLPWNYEASLEALPA